MTIGSGPISAAPIGAYVGTQQIVTGEIAAGIRIAVADVGAAAAGVRVSVFDAAALPAPLRIQIFDAATLAAGLRVSVGDPTAQISAPLRIIVGETQPIIGGLTVAVLPANAYAAGGRWRPVLTLAGMDESVRVTGIIEVLAEEGQARVAEFVLQPGAGPVNPAIWVGRAVTLDYAVRADDGSALYPQRLFTGVIDQPEYDPVQRLIRIRATDDLQGICAALPRTWLDSLIGGYWSGAIFDAAADNWQYAQDRASTQPAAIDCTPWRSLRKTSWEAAASPYVTYDASMIVDGSLSVQLAQRSDIRNRIDVRFSYRVPILKKRVFSAGYNYPFHLSQIMINGYTIPTRQMIGDAIRSAGWELAGKINYVPVPAGPLTVNLGGSFGVWTTTADVAQELCFGFSARLKKRYTQRRDEVYELLVRNDASIAAVGEMAGSRSASLASEFDTGEWERYREPGAVEGSMYETQGTHEPSPILPDIAAGEVAIEYPGVAGQDDRAAAQAAMETLVAQAQAEIWASHRGNRVMFATPLDGRIDLDSTLRIDVPSVSAKGKVRRVRHLMDCDAGRAVSEIELAICAAVGVGIIHPHSTPDAPAAAIPSVAGAQEPTHVVGAHVGQAWYSGPLDPSTMFGYFTNVSRLSPDYSATAPTYPVQFSMRVPEIEAASRDNLTVTERAEYQARIVEDEFAVSA